jgi:hypothetical protein
MSLFFSTYVFKIVDIAVLSSVSITKRDRYFVFKTATEENLVSHKYVVTNGNKISKAYFPGGARPTVWKQLPYTVVIHQQIIIVSLCYLTF